MSYTTLELNLEGQVAWLTLNRPDALNAMNRQLVDDLREHVVLDRVIASRGRFPAIDVLASLSRVMPAVTEDAHRDSASAMRRLIAAYEEKRDLISLGAYREGSDPRVDAAVARIDAIETFLAQAPTERADFANALSALRSVVA